MLPTDKKEEIIQSDPVKRNFNDLDGLLQELSVPKEQINKSLPTNGQLLPGQPSNIPADLMDGPETITEPISQESAKKTGERIATTFDYAFGLGASIYAKSDDRKSYSADDTDLHDLSNAWADVSSKYSWKVEDSPWFNVIVLIIAVYFPMWRKASTARDLALVYERIEKDKLETNRRLAELEKKQLESTPA